ncbi:MAG: hypothetical protein ACE1YV_03145 [Nitrosopumilaceae archaeon]
MLPRGLIIAILIGVLAGGIFGAFFLNLQDFNRLEYVDGPSLSIITLKTDYEIGEDIEIRIINSGTQVLTFSDASYGLKITGLNGRELYSPISAQVISKLEPKQEMTFVWDQIKNDGDPLQRGTYKITSRANDAQEKTVKKSITINIYK